VEVISTGGQASRRAVAPSDDDDDYQNVLSLYFTLKVMAVYSIES
jgi:hypothetical protein